MRKYGDLNRFHTLLRLGLGLPVRVLPNKPVPWGYRRSPKDRYYAIPNDRELRALRKAYELREKNCAWEDIRKWLIENIGRTISRPKLCQLFAERPIFEEVNLHIDERERIYRTPPAETRAI
jgi:hypothetical protein